MLPAPAEPAASCETDVVPRALWTLLQNAAVAQPIIGLSFAALDAAGGRDPVIAARLRYLAARWCAQPLTQLCGLQGDPPADSPITGRALRVVRASLESRGPDQQTALRTLLKIEGELVEAGDDVHLLSVRSDLGRIFATRGSASQAVAAFTEAAEGARRLRDPYFEGLNLLNLGFCFAEKNEPKRYAEHTREALWVFERIGDPHGTAMAHINLAGALQNLGALDEAEAHYAAAEATIDGRGWHYLEALTHAGQGGVACRRGQLELGRGLYSLANTRLLMMDNLFQIARHQLLLGEAFLEAGQLGPAKELLTDAVTRCVEGGYRQTESQARLFLATAEERAQNPQQAIAELRALIKVQQAVFDELLESRLRDEHQRAALEAARAEAIRERSQAESLRALNARLNAALEAQRALQEQLEIAARTDPLTGLSNRRYLRERLDIELARLRRHPRPLSVMVLDVDYFKRINDQYGHHAGDDVLVGLAQRLRSSLRAADLLARWGGEELCVALPETPLPSAMVVAELLRTRVADTPFPTQAGTISITLSIGVAVVDIDAPDIDDTLRRADMALYAAKRHGRDRVAVG